MRKIKCVVAKDGRVMMANENVARKFGSKTLASRFVKNIVKTSKKITMKNFEFIAI